MIEADQFFAQYLSPQMQKASAKKPVASASDTRLLFLNTQQIRLSPPVSNKKISYLDPPSKSSNQLQAQMFKSSVAIPQLLPENSERNNDFPKLTSDRKNATNFINNNVDQRNEISQLRAKCKKRKDYLAKLNQLLIDKDQIISQLENQKTKIDWDLYYIFIEVLSKNQKYQQLLLNYSESQADPKLALTNISQALERDLQADFLQLQFEQHRQEIYLTKRDFCDLLKINQNKTWDEIKKTIQRSLVDAKTNLETFKQTEDKFLQQIQLQKDQLTSLEKNLADYQHQEKNLQDQIKQIEELNQKLQQQYQTLETEYNLSKQQSKSDHQSREEFIKGLQQTIQEMEQVFSEKEEQENSEILCLSTKLEECKNQIMDQEGTIQEMNEAFEQQGELLQGLVNQALEKDNIIQSLEKKIAVTNQQLQETQLLLEEVKLRQSEQNKKLTGIIEQQQQELSLTKDQLRKENEESQELKRQIEQFSLLQSVFEKEKAYYNLEILQVKKANLQLVQEKDCLIQNNKLELTRLCQQFQEGSQQGKQLEKTISELNEELLKVRAEKEAQQLKLSSTEKQLKSITTEKDLIKRKIQEVELMNKELKQQLIDQSEQVQSSRRIRIQELEKQNFELKQENEDFQNEKCDLQVKLNQLELCLKKSKFEKEQLTLKLADLAKMDQQNETLTLEASDLSKQCRELANEKKELEIELKDYKATLLLNQRMQEQITDLEQKQSYWSQEKINLKNQLSVLAESETQAKKYQSQIEELEKKCCNTLKVNEELNARVNELDRTTQDLKVVVSEKDEELYNQVSTIYRLEEQLEEQQSIINKQDNKVNESISGLKEQQLQYEMNLNELSIVNKQLKNEITQKQEQLNDEKQSNLQKITKLKQIQQQQITLQERNHLIEQEIQQLKKVISDQDDQKNGYENEILKERKKNKQVLQQCDELKSELELLQEQNSRLQTSSRDQKKEMTGIKLQLSCLLDEKDLMEESKLKLQEELSQIRDNLNNTQMELVQEKDQKKHLEENLLLKNTDLEKYQKLECSLAKELCDIQKELQIQQKNLANQSKQMEQLAMEKKRVTTQLSELESEYQNLSMKFKENEVSLVKESQEKQELNDQLRSFENHQSFQEEVVQRDSQKIKDLQKIIINLRSEMSYFQEHTKQSEGQLCQIVKEYQQKYAEINQRMQEMSKMVKEKQDELSRVKLEMEDCHIKLSVYQIKDETTKKLISRVLRYFERKRPQKEEPIEEMLDCLMKQTQAHFNALKEKVEEDEEDELKENVPFSLEEISNIY